MKKTSDHMMEIWNKSLDSLQCKLRVINYSNRTIIFNTTFSIEGNTEINRFTQRLESKNEFMDGLYDCDEQIRIYNTKLMISMRAKKGGHACQSIHHNKIKKNLNTGVPWNKGKKGSISWNKGLTKENTPSLMNLSISRKGIGNPMYGKTPTDETKNKTSNRMKELILNGDFTPNIHNSRTHKMILYKGCKYRSSWEVLFAYLHPECEYEKIRIPYFDGIKNKIHITDFVDERNNIVYEVKPKCHKDNTAIKIKIREATKWCSNNGYVYKLITENELFDNINEKLFDIFDEHTKILLKRSCETYKKNRN